MVGANYSNFYINDHGITYHQHCSWHHGTGYCHHDFHFADLSFSLDGSFSHTPASAGVVFWAAVASSIALINQSTGKFPRGARHRVASRNITPSIMGGHQIENGLSSWNRRTGLDYSLGYFGTALVPRHDGSVGKTNASSGPEAAFTFAPHLLEGS